MELSGGKLGTPPNFDRGGGGGERTDPTCASRFLHISFNNAWFVNMYTV